jgi:DedD protein
MAFFKSRKAGDDAAASPRQSESIEAMRRRARHRLIGAAVLVLAGVIGFPLLFDTQPRPVAVDIPIEIPDRNKVKPLAVPRAEAQGPVTVASAAPPAVVAAAPAAPVAAPKAEDKPAAAPVPEPTPAPVAVAKPQPKPETRPEPKTVGKAEPVKATATAPDDGAKARALLEGKPAAESGPAAAEGRFVVQVGAFADPAKARETRLRVEKAGLKTYTHVAETKDGKRIRVRVGPFANRSEADKAAEKIKGLDLPAAILTL